MFTITNYQGNANQKHNEIPPHIAWMAIIKNQKITSVGEDVEKWNSLYTVGGNLKWCSLYGSMGVALTCLIYQNAVGLTCLPRQASANFFCKETNTKYFRLCRP